MNILEKIDNYIDEAAMGKVFVGSKAFGKQKSKAWFKYRGLIAGSKSKKELSSVMHKMSKEVDKNELQDLTNQALDKMERLE